MELFSTFINGFSLVSEFMQIKIPKSEIVPIIKEFTCDLAQGSHFYENSFKWVKFIIAQYDSGSGWYMNVISFGGYALMTYSGTHVGVILDKTNGRVTNQYTSGGFKLTKIIAFYY